MITVANIVAALLVVRGTLLIIHSFEGGSVADPKNIWVVKSKNICTHTIYYTNTPHHHEPTCTPRRARWCSTSCSPSCRRAYTWTRTPACTGSRSPPRSSCRTQSCIAGRSPAVKIFKVTLKLFNLKSRLAAALLKEGVLDGAVDGVVGGAALGTLAIVSTRSWGSNYDSKGRVWYLSNENWSSTRQQICNDIVKPIASNVLVENLHKEMSIGAFSELSPFNLDHVAWLEEGMVGLTERWDTAPMHELEIMCNLQYFNPSTVSLAGFFNLSPIYQCFDNFSKYLYTAEDLSQQDF